MNVSSRMTISSARSRVKETPPARVFSRNTCGPESVWNCFTAAMRSSAETPPTTLRVLMPRLLISLSKRLIMEVNWLATTTFRASGPSWPSLSIPSSVKNSRSQSSLFEGSSGLNTSTSYPSLSIFRSSFPKQLANCLRRVISARTPLATRVPFSRVASACSTIW